MPSNSKILQLQRNLVKKLRNDNVWNHYHPQISRMRETPYFGNSINPSWNSKWDLPHSRNLGAKIAPSTSLIPLICGTKQVRIWSESGPYDNYTDPRINSLKEGIDIDLELSAVTTIQSVAKKLDFFAFSFINWPFSTSFKTS